MIRSLMLVELTVMMTSNLCYVTYATSDKQVSAVPNKKKNTNKMTNQADMSKEQITNSTKL